MIRCTEEAVTMFYSVEVAGNLSDYSLDKSSNYSGGSAWDTGIYYQNDLIAVVQDNYMFSLNTTLSTAALR